jgi:thioredoxin 1
MTSQKMISVTDADFATQVEQAAENAVLVDFGATWCGPCKALGATLDGMIDDYKDTVKFCYVDIQNAPFTAQRFSIHSVPTLVIFKGGAPAGSLLGAQPRSRIDALIRSAL